MSQTCHYDYGESGDSWFQLDFGQKERKGLKVPDARAINLQPVRNEYIQFSLTEIRTHK